MKFVLKNPMVDGGNEEDSDEERYMLNLLEANEKVNWQDVVQVKHQMINSKSITCPICMNSLE